MEESAEEVFNDARFVKWKGDDIYVWHGGPMVNIYWESNRGVFLITGCFTMGEFNNDIREVIESINNHGE